MFGQAPVDVLVTYWADRIMTVRKMCETDFNGHWQLRFLPYSGGFYEQPADELEDILAIISAVNTRLMEKSEKK